MPRTPKKKGSEKKKERLAERWSDIEEAPSWVAYAKGLRAYETTLREWDEHLRLWEEELEEYEIYLDDHQNPYKRKLDGKKPRVVETNSPKRRSKKTAPDVQWLKDLYNLKDKRK